MTPFHDMSLKDLTVIVHSKPYVFFENIANSTCEMLHLKNVLFLKYELISKLFRNALLALKSFLLTGV